MSRLLRDRALLRRRAPSERSDWGAAGRGGGTGVAGGSSRTVSSDRPPSTPTTGPPPVSRSAHIPPPPSTPTTGPPPVSRSVHVPHRRSPQPVCAGEGGQRRPPGKMKAPIEPRLAADSATIGTNRTDIHTIPTNSGRSTWSAGALHPRSWLQLPFSRRWLGVSGHALVTVGE